MPPPINPQQWGSGGSAVGSLLGALPIVGGVLNGVTQMFTNSANRRFQEKMYGVQRADALEDWHMQNLYNSPAQQMARLRDAGLNPNLVYGSGATAQSTQAPRSSSVSGTSGNAPRFDITGVLPMLMFQLKEQMQAQQIENLKTQNLVLQSQAGKNLAQTENITVDTAQRKFNLNMSEVLRDVDIAIRSGELDKITWGNQIMLSANERAAASNTQSIKESVQRILNMRLQGNLTALAYEKMQKQIELLGKDIRIRELDAKLADQNIRPGDPGFWRYVTMVIQALKDAASGSPFTGWMFKK